MSDQRLARRQIAQPSPKASDVPTPESLDNDLDDIKERMPDDEASIANAKPRPTPRPSAEPTATTQSPDSFHLNDESDVKQFNIEQLEQELDVAIAAELGEDSPRSNIDESEESHSTTQVEEASPTSPCNADSRDSQAAEDKQNEQAEQAEEAEEVEEQPSAVADTTPRRSLIERMLHPCTARVQGLSPRARMLLNVFVISTALWVPVVWMLALTNGLGMIGQTNTVDSGVNESAVTAETSQDE